MFDIKWHDSQKDNSQDVIYFHSILIKTLLVIQMREQDSVGYIE